MSFLLFAVSQLFFTDGTTGNARPRTILEVCTLYLDIAAVPRRYFFELLSHFATDLREADRLLEFSTPTVEGWFIPFPFSFC